MVEHQLVRMSTKATFMEACSVILGQGKWMVGLAQCLLGQASLSEHWFLRHGMGEGL